MKQDLRNRITGAEDAARHIRNRVRERGGPLPHDVEQLADAVAKGFQAILEALNAVRYYD